MSELTLEQKKEMFESLKAIGYTKLTGEKKKLYKELKEEFEKDSLDDSNQDSEKKSEETTEEPEKKQEVVENPFKRKSKSEDAPVVTEKIETTASYKVKDNVLTGDDYFKKDQIISGSHPKAQNLLRENLISKI